MILGEPLSSGPHPGGGAELARVAPVGRRWRSEEQSGSLLWGLSTHKNVPFRAKGSVETGDLLRY
jgi:hypothetical protein